MPTLLIVFGAGLALALLICLGFRLLLPDGAEALRLASLTRSGRLWNTQRIGRSLPPKTGNTLWLSPSPAWERRRRRAMAAWNTRWLWGSALIVGFIALGVYTLLHAQQWWSPILAAFFLPWWCSVFLRDSRPNAEAASMQLGVRDHRILLRDWNGSVSTYRPEELGFDGIHLTTPAHRIKLTRRASLRDYASKEATRVGLFDHALLLERVLPLLAQSPLTIEQEHRHQPA